MDLKQRRQFAALLLFGVWFGVLSGCGKPTPPVQNAAPVAVTPKPPVVRKVPVVPKPQKRATDRHANLKGGVLVLMYHKFGVREGAFQRSFDHFREDLVRLYHLGFRPITVSDYLANRVSIPPGASPVIITIDDANPTQLTLDRKGEVVPDCGYAVWREFAHQHPDFPAKGTWYVVPTVMWGQQEWVKKKVEILKAAGSELACHTWNHPSMRYLSREQVKRQISRSLDYLEKLGFTNVSLAYPYGIYPRHMDVLKGFWKNHKAYRLTGAVTCDPEFAPSPTSHQLRRFKVPRIGTARGILGIDYWLDRVKARKVAPYVTP